MVNDVEMKKGKGEKEKIEEYKVLIDREGD